MHQSILYATVVGLAPPCDTMPESWLLSVETDELRSVTAEFEAPPVPENATPKAPTERMIATNATPIAAQVVPLVPVFDISVCDMN